MNSITRVKSHRLSAVLFPLVLLLGVGFSSCRSPQDGQQGTPQLILPSGEKVRVRLATTPQEQTQGLSGLRSEQFADDEGMLFYYSHSQIRSFWMPDTYFNLDIFFLDEKFKVVDVERDVKAHPGRQTPPQIPVTRGVYCRHVLELRADSPLAKKLTVGDVLKWKGKRP